MKRVEIKPFIVTADSTTGGSKVTEFYSEEATARTQADYLHNHPGFMNAALQGPAYAGPKAAMTIHDQRVGAWMAAALDDRKVCPSMKYDINLWMDSKEWV